MDRRTAMHVASGEGESPGAVGRAPSTPAARGAFRSRGEERGRGGGHWLVLRVQQPLVPRSGVGLGEGLGGLPGHPWDPRCPPRCLLPQPGAGCSGFAVGRAVPEGGGELAEGGSVLGAGRPAALHQLGEPRRAALGRGELRLSRLQPWGGSRGWRGVRERRDPLRAASGDAVLSPRSAKGG